MRRTVCREQRAARKAKGDMRRNEQEGDYESNKQQGEMQKAIGKATTSKKRRYLVETSNSNKQQEGRCDKSNEKDKRR